MLQTASRTYKMMQSLLQVCFKTARAKKEEPKEKFNSKAKSVRTENYSCTQNSCKIFETLFLPIIRNCCSRLEICTEVGEWEMNVCMYSRYD